jgi:hypothetical protein
MSVVAGEQPTPNAIAIAASPASVPVAFLDEMRERYERSADIDFLLGSLKDSSVHMPVGQCPQARQRVLAVEGSPDSVPTEAGGGGPA